jgi:hypothetical protein
MSKIKTINIGPNTWVETLPLLLAALQHGTPQGKLMARNELKRMAQVADLLLTGCEQKKTRKRK